MIQYSLKCAQGHTFDSWFQSAGAFEKLSLAHMVTCAVCGGDKVEKAIMAPRVRPARDAAVPATTAEASQKPRPLSEPATTAEQAFAELRRKVEANSDYVGKDFVTQARAMHDGTAPERPIHGEARLDEARKLVEDGVPVMPLPFMSNRKTN